MKKFSTLFLAALFLCVWSVSAHAFLRVTITHSKSGRKWDSNLIFLIEKGKTTAMQIATVFGPPQKELTGKTGRIWTYSYSEATNALVFRPFQAPQSGVAEGENGTLAIWFNAAGIVTDVNLSIQKYNDPALQFAIKEYQDQEIAQKKQMEELQKGKRNIKGSLNGISPE